MVSVGVGVGGSVVGGGLGVSVGVGVGGSVVGGGLLDGGGLPDAGGLGWLLGWFVPGAGEGAAEDGGGCGAGTASGGSGRTCPGEATRTGALPGANTGRVAGGPLTTGLARCALCVGTRATVNTSDPLQPLVAAHVRPAVDKNAVRPKAISSGHATRGRAASQPSARRGRLR